MIPLGNLDAPTCYKVLGLPHGASRDDVRRVRRSWAKRVHPDLFHSDPKREREQQESMKRVNQACDFLERRFEDGSTQVSARDTEGTAASRDEEAARAQAEEE